MSKDSATHISNFMGRIKVGDRINPPVSVENGHELYDPNVQSRFRKFDDGWFGYRYDQILTTTSTSTSTTTTTTTSTSTTTTVTLTTSTSTSTTTTL